ncbi:MAG: ABC transporter ATP-binding protein, partial [Bacillota bacterium]|nr:ABC transporter ATP-binding protein [Bacillota bacterium]
GLPASQFLLYFASLTGFTQWTKGLLDQFGELRKMSLDLNRIRKFLEWPEPFNLQKGEPIGKDLSKSYEIRFENVGFVYPESNESTLSEINLTVRAGEKLAVVGLNGAGKTTLVKLACGFLDPTEGRVLLNGTDIRTYNRESYYRLFSAVFQQFSVLEASVEENICQKPEEFITERDREQIVSCLEKADLMKKVEEIGGLSAKIGREVYDDGVELSGGQKQRMMLARALYKDGAIIVLDEPTAALDPIAEHQIYMKYGEMTHGRTSIFISHRLASTRFCDRVLFMKDGKIAEEGTHESLMKLGGGYAELFEVQSRYYQEDHPEFVKGGEDE